MVGCGVWCVACGVVWCEVRIVKVVLGASEEWVDSCREEAGIQGMKQERLSSSVYNIVPVAAAALGQGAGVEVGGVGRQAVRAVGV